MYASAGITVQHRTSSSTFLLGTAARAPCIKRYERKVSRFDCMHLCKCSACT